MSEPVGSKEFNPEDYAALQLRLTPGFSNIRIDKSFPDNEPFSQEGRSQNLSTFMGGAGIHYLIPVGKITSNFWQLSVGADVLGQAGSLNGVGLNFAPALIHRWGGGQYEWRLEANYTPTNMFSSNDFFFPQDPQGRTWKVTSGIVQGFGAAMSMGIHLNDHVMIGFLVGGSTYTNLKAHNKGDANDILDVSPTVNVRLAPVITIHPFGSAKSRVYEATSEDEALDQMHILRNSWQWSEIAYRQAKKGLQVRFSDEENRSWASLSKAGPGNPVAEVSHLLDEIYRLMRSGGLDTGSVRVQIIGHAKESGHPYQDARKASEAAHALQRAVEQQIKEEPYSRMKPILVASTHYGAERKDADIILVHILLDSDEPQKGPDLEALRRESVDQKTDELFAQVRSLSHEINMARMSFPDERTTNFDDGPNSPFEGVYKTIIEPTLEIMALIRQVSDPDLKKYLRDNMRIQLTGHAYNVALADPPPGQTEKEYYAKTNRLPQYFLDVGLQRAQGVKTAVLNAVDKDVGGYISAYAKSQDVDESMIRKWLHEIFSIEPAAPFTRDHQVTIRQARRLYGLVPGQPMGGLEALNENPYVERVIELHYDGDFFEKDHLQETDNSNHVKFHPLIPFEGRPVKSFKTPFLTDKALCKNTPCNPVEASQTRREGRVNSPRPQRVPVAKPPHGSSEGRGEPR